MGTGVLNYNDFKIVPESPLVLSISSGKGGVGKTFSAVYLSMVYAKLGYKVLLIDGDFGLSNVEVLLNLRPQFNIHSMLEEGVGLENVMVEGPLGVKIISSGSGILSLTKLSYLKKQLLMEKINRIKERFHVVIFDNGAGIGQNVVNINRLANSKLILTTPENTSLTDSYALLKVLKQEQGLKQAQLMLNKVVSSRQGDRLADRFSKVVKEHLNVDLSYLGCVQRLPEINQHALSPHIDWSQCTQSIQGQAYKGIACGILAQYKKWVQKPNQNAKNIQQIFTTFVPSSSYEGNL